jgi:hypothetical protein
MFFECKNIHNEHDRVRYFERDRVFDDFFFFLIHWSIYIPYGLYKNRQCSSSDMLI